MTTLSETIAAIATAPGEAGIGVVRVSGPECLTIADRIVLTRGAPPSQRPPGSAFHAFVRAAGSDTGGPHADEVVVLIFRAPHSYTGEDTVELQGHGGRMAPRRVLRAVLEAGARLAEPGEFTRRAFLNGRIDLTQAEAVGDLIRAHSDRAAISALEQIDGSLRSLLTDTCTRLIDLVAAIEAGLDFPEEDIPGWDAKKAEQPVRTALRDIDALLATWNEGRTIREGALVVIAGQPNVGKSTLMNRLLGVDRSIVTDVPGTTRDTIEDEIIIDGYPIRLVDTAGLRQSECVIENMGINRAKRMIESADLVLYLINAYATVTNSDTDEISALDASQTIVVANKSDLGDAIGQNPFNGYRLLRTSMLSDGSIDDIRRAITECLHLQGGRPHAAISERHRQLLLRARDLLDEAHGLIQQGREDTGPIVASTIRRSLDAIGEITGMSYSATLLDTIFSRFCIGK